MSSRKPVTAETIAAVASQFAGAPVDADRAQAHAEAWEPLLNTIATLRNLPIKDLEPPILFSPEEDES